MNISCFSDESCILDVTWEVVYCNKGYLLSIHSQHDGSEGGDGIVLSDLQLPLNLGLAFY